MPPGEPAQVVSQLEADRAAERRGTGEADLAAQQVGAEGGDDEVEERDDEHAAVDVGDQEDEVQRVEGAERGRRRERLAAVLERVPQQAVALTQAAQRVHDVRVGRGIDVVGGDALALGAPGHVPEHPPAGGEREQRQERHGRQAIADAVH